MLSAASASLNRKPAKIASGSSSANVSPSGGRKSCLRSSASAAHAAAIALRVAMNTLVWTKAIDLQFREADRIQTERGDVKRPQRACTRSPGVVSAGERDLAQPDQQYVDEEHACRGSEACVDGRDPATAREPEPTGRPSPKRARRPSTATPRGRHG